MPPRQQRPPRPVLPVPPVPFVPPAPAPAPVAPRRRRPARRFSAVLLWMAVGALTALFAANLAGYGPAIVWHEKVRVVLPPQRSAQPAKQSATSRPVALNSQVTTPATVPPAPTSAVTPPAPDRQSVDVNININVRGLPDRPVQIQTATCPKVGYYVLSHEPTTDSRQYDDRGNWNPGHMELVRECRNGALVEFPRWIGHHLPSAPAPYYLPPQAP